MTRRYLLFTAVIVVFAIAAACVAASCGTSSRRGGQPKRIGADPVAAVTIPRPQDALEFWKERFHGRVVIVCDSEWPRFDATKYYTADIFRKYPLRVVNLAHETERGHLSDLNFLYFASLRGIIRDIRIVLPRDALADVATRAATAHNARISDGEIFFTHHGLPRTFSTLDRLKSPAEPALIFVGARFFASCEPATLYRRLADLGVTTDSIVVSSGAGEIPVGERERQKLAEFVRLVGGRG